MRRRVCRFRCRGRDVRRCGRCNPVPIFSVKEVEVVLDEFPDRKLFERNLCYENSPCLGVLASKDGYAYAPITRVATRGLLTRVTGNARATSDKPLYWTAAGQMVQRTQVKAAIHVTLITSAPALLVGALGLP